MRFRVQGLRASGSRAEGIVGLEASVGFWGLGSGGLGLKLRVYVKG